MTTNAERQRRYRDRKRGGPPPEPELRPHGTRAAIRRHERQGSPLCALCREERNRLAREAYRARKR